MYMGYVCREARGGHLVSCCIPLHLTPLGQGLTELELGWQPAVPSCPPVSVPHSSMVTSCALYVVPGTCTQFLLRVHSALLSEAQSLQPLNFILNLLLCTYFLL